MAIEPARKPKQPHQRQAPQTESWRDWVINISSLWPEDLPVPKSTLRHTKPKPTTTEEEDRAFWDMCDRVAGPGKELDWEEHLKNMNETRYRSIPND